MNAGYAAAQDAQAAPNDAANINTEGLALRIIIKSS